MKFEGSFDFSKLEKGANQARTKGLIQAGEHIRQVSAELAPKELGSLAGSADVRMTSDGHLTVVFPGPYARYQEFGVFYRHGRFGAPLRHDNGQSFFLTTAMNTEKDRCIDIMADALKEDL
ncbi:hypothetical protein PT279_09040 [Bifidobacterium sp. ESL0784]|uniref:hypothetical protein n=1 Tax=Bifidobacterium sp. ESL0784 TaxID=2983231 RepID=UPI0023F89F4F|nr:hypothetical protein [Bifidobacterium sp. ESL0784]MDF7641727.1 hypothetical protein [Bifidobacterium sp. ESL0784]